MMSWRMASHWCLVAVALAQLVLVGGACRQAAEAPAASAAAPVAKPEPQVAAASTEILRPLTTMASAYENLQAQAVRTRGELAEALNRYERRGGDLPPDFGPDLTEEQRIFLADRLRAEPASRGVLQEILTTDRRLQEIKVQTEALADRLPDHKAAQAGDRHYRLAMDYLIARGVPVAKAYDVVKSLNLEEPLLPGSHVWTYYEDGQFGTWVTAGSAVPSKQPEIQPVAATRPTVSREDALRAARLQAQLQAMQDREAQARRQAELAEQQARDASAESGALMDMLAKAEEQRKALENVIQYSIGSKRQLEGQKVIRRMRLESFEGAQMRSLDLGTTRDITADAASFGLNAIRKVTLLPGVFALGTDYQVVVSGTSATIRVLNADKFRKNQFVVVLE
jgi:hypothetical protein